MNRLIVFLILILVQVQAFSKEIKKSWAGQYRQAKGNYILKIEDEVEDLISVGIYKIGKTEPHIYFLAVVKGYSAKMTSPHEEKDCQMNIKQVKAGIVLSDFCGGKDDSGFYERIKK